MYDDENLQIIIDQLIAKYELKYTGAILKAKNKATQKAINNFLLTGKIDPQFIMNEHEQILSSILAEMSKNISTITIYNYTAIRLAGADIPTKPIFDYAKMAEKYMSDYGLSTSRLASSTLLKDLRNTLQNAIKQNLSERKTAKYIKAVMNNVALHRATTIARTETYRAYDYANREVSDYITNLGIPLSKVWLTARDERVRNTHRVLHKKAVGQNEVFYVGGYPAPAPRQTGIAREDINCRCSVIYKIIE